MSIEIRDNADGEQYEIFVDDQLAGLARYKTAGDIIAFVHTEVDDAFEGQGLAGKLVTGALDDVRGKGLGVLPFCQYVRGFIAKHREYVDLVPEAERSRFGLA